MVESKVRIKFFAAEQGGRSTPPASRYRAPVWFGGVDGDGEPVLWDCHFEFAAQPALGRKVEAWLRSAAAPRDVLRPGAAFEVREGAHTVACGEILAGAA